jgi:hypothetical protein
MSFAFLRIIEALQNSNSPDDTKWALALADKLPLDDHQRGLIARELIAATARCQRCG